MLSSGHFTNINILVDDGGDEEEDVEENERKKKWKNAEWDEEGEQKKEPLTTSHLK